MMNRLLCAILLLLMIAPAAAQDAAPFPVLDEAAIFADGVTVIERLPVLNFDNEARQLYYFEPDKNLWETYSYPDDGTEFGYFLPRSDGNYELWTNEEGILGSFGADVNWVFDSFTRQILQAESICGLAGDAPNEGIWRLSNVFDDNLFRLCHTSTGEITAVLPEIMQSRIAIEDNIVPNQTPNGDWVIIPLRPKKVGNAYELYSLNVRTMEFHFLGTGGSFQFDFIWFDSTKPLMINLSGNRLILTSVPDTRIEGSFTPIATTYQIPEYFDNPPIIIYGDKTVYRYDVNTGEHTFLYERPCTELVEICTGRALSNEAQSSYYLDIIGISSPPSDEDQIVSLIDVEAQEILYQTVARQAMWINEDSFLLALSEDRKTKIRRIDIQDGNVISDQIMEIEFTQFPISEIFGDGRFVLLDYGTTPNIDVFDLATNTQYKLLEIDETLLLDADLFYRAEVIDNVMIKISIGRAMETIYQPLGEWYVTLPILNEDNNS